ncbi:hypothetical protein, partial [Klebsiella pneumoniae]|uniref:hypothetical protein n=1 Tax=Klebsiella pneumoniae TaxID=573 RepID=UPI0025A260D7
NATKPSAHQYFNFLFACFRWGEHLKGISFRIFYCSDHYRMTLFTFYFYVASAIFEACDDIPAVNAMPLEWYPFINSLHRYSLYRSH